MFPSKRLFSTFRSPCFRAFGSSSQQNLVGKVSLKFQPEPCIFGSQQFWLERRRAKYLDLQKRIRLHHPGIMMANGKTYQLPVCHDGVPLIDTSEGIPPQELKKFAVMFADLGCVSPSTENNRNVLRLVVSKNYARGEILLELLRVFGGKITAGNSYEGISGATVKWNVTSEKAKSVCALLATVPTPRQEIFALASRWPGSDRKPERPAFVKQLRYLTHESKREWPLHMLNSAEAFGALFDRHACVQITTKGVVQIYLLCHNSNQRSHVQQFLSSQGVPSGSAYTQIRSHYTQYNLCWTNKEDQRRILQYVQPLLLAKKNCVDAILARPWNIQAHTQLRQHLFRSCSVKSLMLRRRSDDLLKLQMGIYQKQKYVHSLWSQNKCVSQDKIDTVHMLQKKLHVEKLCHQARAERDRVRHFLDRGASVLPARQFKCFNV